MPMTSLQVLSESVQQFAEVLKAAIHLEVDVFDRDLNRVAGTGLTKGKVGRKIDPHGIVNTQIYNGEDRVIIDAPGVSTKCAACAHYGHCIYKKAVYASIKQGPHIIGAMGILALDEAQEKALDNNTEVMLDLVDKIAGLIGSKVSDYEMNNKLRKAVLGSSNTIGLDQIISSSSVMDAFKKQVSRVATADSTVLLVGETGTGKELFSRALHTLSHRQNKPFVAINCGALPENLIESELFGYEKGAFTGANKEGKQGKFYLAHQGTVFLDEVENMPLYMQQKLLRVIENREIEPLGAEKTLPIDIRVIAASNKNLEKMVEEGRFREDLYHRLNVIMLEIPPLRERGVDILVLSKHFIEHYNKKVNKQVKGLSEAVKSLFTSYRWTGNVRELQNVIEYAMTMETLEEIQLVNLPDRIKDHQSTYNVLEEIEKEFIIKALKKYGWSDEAKERAALELGISRSTIYRKIRKYKIKKDC